MSQNEHGHISLTTYTVVFFLLLILLVVTVGITYFDFGALNVPIAMTIATAKAALIATYFMHLRVSSRWITLFFLATIYVFLLGGILLFNDYSYRL